jgi:hypothetical protein
VPRWWAWFLPPPASRLRPLESRDVWLAIAIAGIGTGIKACGARLFLTPFDLTTSTWRFGFEVGHIAANVAAGHGYTIATTDGGAIPTAWASPAYPLLLAAIFRVWGAFTAGSADVVVALNCLLQGATAGLLYAFGLRLAGRRAGGIAAILFLAQPGGWQFLAWAWPSHLLALATAPPLRCCPSHCWWRRAAGRRARRRGRCSPRSCPSSSCCRRGCFATSASSVCSTRCEETSV